MLNEKDISIEDFDALVTGHFTHYAIWYENAYSDAIKHFFSTGNSDIDNLFSDFFMNAQHIGFEKKSQILKKIFQIKHPDSQEKFIQLSKKIEIFRSKRNILAHGLLDPDNSTELPLKINVFLDGKDISIEITPMIFDSMLDDCNNTLDELVNLLNKLKS